MDKVYTAQLHLSFLGMSGSDGAEGGLATVRMVNHGDRTFVFRPREEESGLVSLRVTRMAGDPRIAEYRGMEIDGVLFKPRQAEVCFYDLSFHELAGPVPGSVRVEMSGDPGRYFEIVYEPVASGDLIFGFAHQFRCISCCPGRVAMRHMERRPGGCSLEFLEVL